MPYEEEPSVLAYRVRQHGDKLIELEAWRRQVDHGDAVTSNEIKNIQVSLEAVIEELRAGRRMLLTFALTISISLLTFSLSILVATGKL